MEYLDSNSNSDSNQDPNKGPWAKRWLGQMDKAHADLAKLLELRSAAERYLEGLDLGIEAQLFLMALIDMQIAPEAPE
jgi:hypothetical protein